jgi:hypothetical protein
MRNYGKFLLAVRNIFSWSASQGALLISWIAVVGGAITLFSNVVAIRKLASWAKWMVAEWNDWLLACWKPLFQLVGLETEQPLAQDATFAVVVFLIALASRIHYHRSWVIKKPTLTRLEYAQAMREAEPIINWNVAFQWNVLIAITLYLSLPYYLPNIVSIVDSAITSKVALAITKLSLFYGAVVIFFYLLVWKWPFKAKIAASFAGGVVVTLFCFGSRLPGSATQADAILGTVILFLGGIVALTVGSPRMFSRRLWSMLFVLLLLVISSEATNLIIDPSRPAVLTNDQKTGRTGFGQPIQVVRHPIQQHPRQRSP